MSTMLANRPHTSGKTTIQFPQMANFLEDLDALSRETARIAFHLFQQRGGYDGRDLDDWLRAESELLRQLPMEMSESDDSFTIRAEMPGFEAKNLTVRADPNSIYIRAKSEQKNEDKKGLKYSELSASEVCRRIALPSSINPERITARLANGMLELTLPKAAPPKTIEIKAA